MSVSITTSAFKQIQFLLAENPGELGLRIAVAQGGCSGNRYSFAFENKAEPNDEVISQDNVSVFIDQESYALLDGSVIDFVDNITSSSFEITNPNVTAKCGCGSSFTCGS